MGSRCYGCGEKFGRCYEHAGDCPDSCTFGRHDCDALVEAVEWSEATFAAGAETWPER